MENTCKAVEVKDYPRIIDLIGKVNSVVVRPRLEAMLDNYEKIHNISPTKTDKDADECLGDGKTVNNK
jgi:hypothetical protein